MTNERADRHSKHDPAVVRHEQEPDTSAIKQQQSSLAGRRCDLHDKERVEHL